MSLRKFLSTLVITVIFSITGLTASQASGTYTQGWIGFTPSQVASATSSTSWESQSTGRNNGPGTKMTFIVPTGTQTVRMSISVNGGTYDTSSVVGCAFRLTSGSNTTTSTTTGSGTSQATLSFVSKSSTAVVCDLTMGSDFADGGFELYTGTLGSWTSPGQQSLTTQVAYIQVSRSSSGSSSSNSDETPTPVYFGGPLVMGSTLPHFTQGEEGTVTLTGKRMNKITSATINGVAVTVTADHRSATVNVPANLASGTYDLVLQTTNGRLTVMRFIKVS